MRSLPFPSLTHTQHYTVNTVYIFRIQSALKRCFSIVVLQLGGRVSLTLWQNVNTYMYRKDRKCFKIVRTNGLSVKDNTNGLMHQNALLRITQSAHSLFTTYLCLLHSGRFMDELFKPCECLYFKENFLKNFIGTNIFLHKSFTSCYKIFKTVRALSLVDRCV